jgi:polyisoprenyl-teichoic acid--peptidoglycan teichoic acid transferase
MNIRKFTLVTSAVLMFFLFIAGTVIMTQLNSSTAAVINGEKVNTPFGGLFEGIIQDKKPVNILVLGGDKVNNNTDTLMLVNYDPSTTRANIVSIPRDTKVKIEDKVRKINFAYPHAGARFAVETVSGLLGVNVKYYIYIDISVFRKIIDKLGGIEDFYVPEDLTYDDPTQNLHIHLQKGYQDLDGEKAEQFMRFRKFNRSKDTLKSENYDGSDIKRITAQQNLIKELIRQKTSIVYIHKFDDVVSEIFNNLETNMSISEILGLAQNISQFKYDNISFYTLPGTAEYSYYILDPGKADEMMKMYFSAEEGFAGSSTSPGINNTYRVQEADGKTEKESDSQKTKKKKSYTKDNPSNNETNVKDQNTPQP